MVTHKLSAPGWIFNLTDYRQMFDLQENDFAKPILDYPGRISSFNAQMHAQGVRVVSGDSLYGLSFEQMQQKSVELFEANEDSLRSHLNWLKENDEKSIEMILKNWRDSEKQFLDDYRAGQSEGRYQNVSLPKLPFKDHEFDLAICTNLIFHTMAMINGNSTEDLVAELCRVAVEARIFPLLNEKGEMPEKLGMLMLNLQQQNYALEVREVPYKQHKGANAMLRVWSTECLV